ncbi:Acetyltransferase (GNAT) family protein [Quadrisphaera granulorum]|uniref:Acetyltransferase (GNAT) family protein n=1 Tax=Quadrisphaera granulorum TaxID=317664 RepID=A0A316A8Z1_9ACTN|nr:GNAT family N-acetyltransferase [Quadrisphaera granulorum]PWJ54215.1 acetyltransferase (GNAT) family protein [Quadrisphaera granulorum]SZE96354.1 Acetyltransferase (GNAT) family protein [Quadrisphaera granulorum]
MTSDVVVRTATLDDVEEVARLFRGYLEFYECPREPAAVTAYLTARIANGESVVLIAEAPAAEAPAAEVPATEDPAADGPAHRGAALGFAQCYPTWASLELAPAWVLYDLFVDPAARGRGVGRVLLRAVAERARAAGATTAVLETAHTNTAAQALYESEGWVPDTTYRTYALTL